VLLSRCKKKLADHTLTEPSLQFLKALQTLLEIIRKLRSPEGCLWDRQQKKQDIGRYLIDEAYEVIDAIDSAVVPALREELGDLLFQILFLVVMAEESREFTLADVMNDVAEKMVRRHPHVFGDRKVRDVDEIKANWKDIKENLENKHHPAGLLDGIPRSLPSLLRAQKITERASRVGFDWSVTEDVLVKVEEELHELKAALKGNPSGNIREEIGDLLFSLVNLSRFADVNADDALRRANQKFSDRFSYMESKLAIQGKTPGQVSREEMDRLWDECKAREKG
jgi:tetrapyrrole methylase family protein/MazG family protein